MKILLVEDNVNDALIIERVLKKKIKNLSIHRLDTEEEFRIELQKDYDIVLSDYSMPDFNGMQALLIRNETKPLIPFIIVTGSVNEATAVECLMAGADNYILKEHPGRLIPAVKKAIEDKKNEKLRIETQNKLNERNRLYNEIVENSDLGIVIESSDRKFIYANSKILEILNYSYDEFKKLRYKDIIHKDDLMAVKRMRDERKHERNKQNDYHIRLRTRDGLIRYVSVHAEDNFWNGKKNGERFYINDITDSYESGRHKQAVNEVAMAALEIDDINKFSKAVCRIVKRYITVTNFYIAIYEGEGSKYRFSFIDDEQYKIKINEKVDIKGSSIDMVRSMKKAVFFTKDDILQYYKKRNMKISFVVPEIWIGVPLIYRHDVIGVVGIKDYHNKSLLTKKDLMFLQEIAPYISIKVFQNSLIKKLRDNERKFRDLYDHTPNAIIVHQNGRIVMANAAAVRLAEVENVEKMLDLSIMDFVHPEYREQVLKRSLKVLSEKEPQQSMIEKFITKKGNEILVDTVSIPFEYEGKPAAQVIMNDVTEELKAKKLLEESELKFRLAFKSSMDAITISELKTGKFIEVNDSFIRITGYKYEEVIGKTAYELNIWLSIDDRAYVVNEIITKGFINNFHTKFVVKSGKIEDALVSGRVIRFDNVDYMMITSRVITEMVETQKKIIESEEKFNSIFNSASDSII